MNKLKQGVFFILLLSVFMSCSQKQSLEWIPFSWKSDTISGKYIEKAYMYVPVKIEDLPYDFTMQFDLGTYNSVFYGNTIAPYLEDYASWADKLDSIGMFRNISLQMGTVSFGGINIVDKKNFGEEIPRELLHSDTPKHIGTIACDVFLDKVLVIDYKSCRLAVSDSVPAEYKDLPAEKIEIVDGITKLLFHINGEECKLLFDTGSSPFQLVTTKERALGLSNQVITDSLSGPLWWGKEITFYGLVVNKPIEFGGKTHENSMIYYDKEGLWNEVYKSLGVWGITGNAYFYDNIVVIDYKNKLFRVK